MKVLDHKAKDATYWRLLQVVFQAKHRMNAMAEQHGLTFMQSNALALLHAGEPLPMSYLASQLACDASNITGIADRLETQGLIKRQDSPTDRRVKMIALTPKGEELQKQIFQEVIQREDARLSPILSAAERDQLNKILDKILKAAAEI